MTKKKKRKPEASTASISSSSSQQTGPVGDNSEATLPRSGGGSPIPFDDGSWTQDTSVPLHSSVLVSIVCGVHVRVCTYTCV